MKELKDRKKKRMKMKTTKDIFIIQNGYWIPISFLTFGHSVGENPKGKKEIQESREMS